MANIALTCTVKGILSMSFVPISRLEEAFQIVENYAAQVHDNLKERTSEFIQYFRNTWMDGPYSPLTWNCFASYLANTNNVAEGYNHAFNSCREFGGTTVNPNIFLLISIFKKELIRTQERAEMIFAGQDPRQRLQTYNFKTRKFQYRLNQMKTLNRNEIDLDTYMQTMGQSSLLTHLERARSQNSDEYDTDQDFDNDTPDHEKAATSNGKKSKEKTSKVTPENVGKKTWKGKQSKDKTSDTKSSNAKNNSRKTTPASVNSQDSSDHNSRTDGKSNQGHSSGKKPATVDLFPTSPGHRTPRRRYLTAETKGELTK